MSSLAGFRLRGEIYGQTSLCGPTIASSWLRFEMEKKSRCSYCEGKLDLSSDSKVCKMCVKNSSEASTPSTSEVRRDQVRGGCLRPALVRPRGHLRLQRVGHVLYAAASNGKRNFSPEYDNRQNSLGGILYYHSDAKPSPSKE